MGMKQIAVRVDRQKVDEMYRMLKEEDMSLQTFLEICVERYVASDPRIRGLIEGWRRENQISKQEKDGGLKLSKRERDQLMQDIESTSKAFDE